MAKWAEPAAVTTDADIDAAIRRLSRRSFTAGAMAAAVGGTALAWLATRASEGGVVWPLRRMLLFNERVAESLFDPQRLVPEFAAEQAVEPRLNGGIGLMSPVAVRDWSLKVVGKATRDVPLVAVLALPAHEMTTEFKCVEGWSQIVRWKGARLADFLGKFAAPSEYIGLSTPPGATDCARPARPLLCRPRSS